MAAVQRWRTWPHNTYADRGRPHHVFEVRTAQNIEQKPLTGKAAVILTDSTIIADSPNSASLTALRTGLDQWEHAARPVADWYRLTLVLNEDNDSPGWDLRLKRHVR